MRASDLISIVRYFGPMTLLEWGAHLFKRRSGYIECRTPARQWADIDSTEVLSPGIPAAPDAYVTFRENASGQFFFPLGCLPAPRLLTQTAGKGAFVRAVEVADACCKGRFLYFSDRMFDLGHGPSWLLNPITRKTAKKNGHWSRRSNFDNALGDIKIIWEPSRFAWVYWLVRAYSVRGDDRYPLRFWELIESWMNANPPQAGPNWQSGQEVAVRAMAICFGLWAFHGHGATTSERVAWAPRLLSEHGRRIEAFIGHAIRQKNNHALSEACGLWTIGMLFPELRKAYEWRRLGKQVLESEALRQIYSDGSYVQHSMNYHRVMLQLLTWGARLGELNHDPLSTSVLDRLGKAANFLSEMLDTDTGRVPNYGANDGALLLPLDGCDYSEYRPAVQAASFAAERKRIFQQGPWDEALVWLFGPDCLNTPTLHKNPVGRQFDDGGYYTLRSGAGWCMVRCHTYRDRPGHCDPLHVDLWWKGINILRDCGTFSYFCPDRAELENFFSSIAAHNTIEVDQQPPMRHVSRFLLVPWGKAKTLSFDQNHWLGEHYGYNRSPWHVIHKRRIDVLGKGWRITDDLLGKNHHEIILRWHLPWGDWRWDTIGMELNMEFEKGNATINVVADGNINARMICGDSVNPEPPAVESRYYSRVEPQVVLEIRRQGILPARTITKVVFEGSD